MYSNGTEHGVELTDLVALEERAGKSITHIITLHKTTFIWGGFSGFGGFRRCSR
jgi:hypothetical protein